MSDKNYIDELKRYQSLLIAGVYPPPYGGVSVHIYRLHKILNNSSVFNLAQQERYKGQNYVRLFFHIIKNKHDAVHLHSTSTFVLFLFYFLHKVKKFKWILTDHNPRLFIAKSGINKSFIKLFISQVDVLILVGEHVLKNYQKELKHIPGQLYVKNAFLPPPQEEKKLIMADYPKAFNDFLNSKESFILANASRLVFYKNEDLYGLDMCVKLIKELVKSNRNIGLIFALSEDVETIKEDKIKDYFKYIENYIKENNLADNVYLLIGKNELWPLMTKIDLFVRPTNTDGDSVSVREALYFNCSVLASNVCERPQGVNLFETRDQNDFYIQATKLLAKK